TVEEQGELLHAKHVLAPNSLGYCGPDENGRILEHLSDSLDSILRRFEAACPFVRMIAKATGLSRFDPAQITEDTSHSWYNQPSPEAVIGEQTPVPDMTNAQAYSWAKSPRFNGQVCESGPLAREYVSGVYPALGKVINSIVSSVPGLPLNPKGSVFDRMVARALELVILNGSNNTTKNLQVLGQDLNLSLVDVLDALGVPQQGLMQHWLDAMDVGAPAYVSSYQNPDQAEGIGLWEAPRGSLFHWVRIKDQKVDDYQVIAPTTWNVSPSGPLEGALVGTPIGSAGTDDDLRQAAYVIRSFDLCLACTVHVVDARGNDRYLKMGQVPPAGKGVNHSVDER
ncbi:MAG: nickel-dependent hydrogenase large subunit, partial [Nitrososphaerota archaeon]|nr:nickel-dependent hydrogenase large subunit [Nitrososphaerota archaeon]